MRDECENGHELDENWRMNVRIGHECENWT